jgi:CheY-like chemotaxis protein
MSSLEPALGPLILVVEDDPYALELLVMRLKHLGCRVLTAKNVEGAYREAVEQQPVLAIVDLRLGDDTTAGLTLLRRLRETPRTQSMCLVVHSIFVGRRAEVLAEAGLVDHVLSKPFKLPELQRLLENLSPPGALRDETGVPGNLSAGVDIELDQV